MSTSPQPRSRRDRPAKPPLTREAIVQAAVEVMEEEGTGRLTLRRVARLLDTGPASLYVYFENGAALQAAVLDKLLGSVTLPAIAPDDNWRQRLIGALWSYTATLLEHPSLARAALVSRLSGPNYLALVEYILEALRAGSIPPERAAWGVDLLLQYATSLAIEHGARQLPEETPSSEEDWVKAISDTPADRYPMIAGLREAIFTGSPRERYAWGVSVLLNGIAETPVTQWLGQRRPAGER